MPGKKWSDSRKFSSMSQSDMVGNGDLDAGSGGVNRSPYPVVPPARQNHRAPSVADSAASTPPEANTP